MSARVHVHLVAWTEEPWDLEESLFSLATQEGVELTASVVVPPALEPFAREASARIARLGAPLTLRMGPPSGWPPDVKAVAVWAAGTVAVPDHLARALASRDSAKVVAVAPVRRVLRRAVSGRPPYVVRKTRRFTSAEPSVDELARDSAFLGRCVVPSARAPGWIPASAEEHRRWADEVWATGPVARVPGPPAVDLPDLRTRRAVRSPGDVRDALADLRYQAPRWLERRAPLVFTRLRRAFHRFRDGTH